MKTSRIVYLAGFGIISLQMLIMGIMQLTNNSAVMNNLVHFQLPLYFFKLLGLAKIIGAIALIQTWSLKVKRAAFYGFVFLLFGAIFMHIAIEDPIMKLLPAIFSLIILLIAETLRNVEVAEQEEHEMSHSSAMDAA